MNRVYEAPKHTKHVQDLLSKAARNESFNELVAALRELMIDHCASPGHMRQALALAIHEQAWFNYKLMQGIPVAPLFEEVEEDPAPDERKFESEAQYYEDDEDGDEEGV